MIKNTHTVLSRNKRRKERARKVEQKPREHKGAEEYAEALYKQWLKLR